MQLIAGAVRTVFDWFIDRPSLSVPRIEEDDSAAVLALVGPPS